VPTYPQRHRNTFATTRSDAKERSLELPDRIKEYAGASVRRIAGGLNPVAARDDELNTGDKEPVINPVAFVRNAITIWFDRTDGDWQNGPSISPANSQLESNIMTRHCIV
jgi:hypothetical protein